MKIISRAEAKERGLLYYFTGQLCKRGHLAKRFASTASCSVCAAANTVGWKQTNKLKVREYRKRWRTANPERAREYVRAWSRRYPERAAASASASYFRNLEKKRLLRRRNYERNKAAYIAANAARKAAKKRALPLWADLVTIRALYAEAEAKSLETGIQHHVDHIIPLKGKNVCGLHVENNLRVVPALINLRKHSRFDDTTGETGPVR